MTVVPIFAGSLATDWNCGVDGSVVRCADGGTVYYGDEQYVTATVNNGSIAVGGSVTLFGTTFFAANSRSTLEIEALPSTVLSGAPSGAAGGDLAGAFPNPTVPDVQKVFAAVSRYGMSTSATGGANTTALQAAITDAQTLGVSLGRQQKVLVDKPGAYYLDFLSHSLMTAPFVAGTDTILKVKDTTDFAASGTLNITDPFFNNVTVTQRATATVAYTGKTATTFTGCTTSVGGGTTYMPGDSVSKQGVDTGQSVIDITAGYVHVECVPGAELWVSDTVTYNQNPNGIGYGPRIFQVGTDDPISGNQKYLRSNVWPNDQHFDVGAVNQPNGYLSGVTGTGVTFTKTAHGLANNDLLKFWSASGGLGLVTGGTYYAQNVTANTFEIALTPSGTSVILGTNLTSAIIGTTAGTFDMGDTVLLYSRASGDYDGGRHNPRAETVEIAYPGEFAAELGAAIPDAVSLGPYTTLNLQNRALPDPDGTNTSTTVKAGVTLAAADVSVQVTDATKLTRKNRVTGQNMPQQSGLLLFSDGTGSELVKFEDVDYATNTVYFQTRALYGTSTPATFATGTSTTVVPVEMALIGSELVAYKSYSTTPSITLALRGVAGTTATTHIASEFVFYVPFPGRGCFRLPFQGADVLQRDRRVPPTTTLTVALGNTYTEGTQVTVEGQDFTRWPDAGCFTIGSEKFTYAYRSHGKLHGVSRGVEGTTVATQSAGATIKADVPGVKLTASLATTNGLVLSVNGASGLVQPNLGNPDGGEVKNLRVGREVIQIKSGIGTSGTSSGMIRPSGKSLSGDHSAAVTTFTLNSVASLPDPVALGVGFCFASVDNEVFTYAGISGSTLTGVQRGHQSLAAAHTSGDTVYCFSTLNVAASGRAYAGTTAESSASGTQNSASYLAGQQVRIGYAPFAAKSVTAQQVTFRNVVIKSAGTRQMIPRVQGNFGESYGNRRTAIKLSFCKTVDIVGCLIDGTERDGVSMEACLDVKVLDSNFYRVNQLGFGYPVDIGGACQNIIVSRNVMRDGRHGGIISGASGLNGNARRVTFSDNHVEDMLNSGWECQAGCEDVLVEGNTFIACNGGSVAMNGSKGRVRGNTIRTSAGSFGVNIGNFNKEDGDIEVSGNYIEGCSTGVIVWLQDTGWRTVRRNTVRITGNTIANSKTHAIQVLNSSGDVGTVKQPGIMIVENTIRGGVYQSGASGAAARIWAQYVDGAIISTNLLFDCGADQEGIYLDQADDCIVNGNQIRFRSATDASSPAGKSGIIVVTGDSNTIIGNRVKDCSAASPIDVSGSTNSNSSLNVVT